MRKTLASTIVGTTFIGLAGCPMVPPPDETKSFTVRIENVSTEETLSPSDESSGVVPHLAEFGYAPAP